MGGCVYDETRSDTVARIHSLTISVPCTGIYMSETNRGLSLHLPRVDSAEEQRETTPAVGDHPMQELVGSPRDVEYEALLHPGDVETYEDLVHIADKVDDGMDKAESEDYRHAFIPYYG